MPPSSKYAVAPPLEVGFQLFVRSAYPPRYNFAVDNYNAVSTVHKARMRGGRLLLFRSVVAVSWIVAMVFAVLATLKQSFVAVTVIVSLFYLALSFYNIHVYIQNRTLLNATRLLRAKVAGPTGADFEWVSVPIDSRSANERLSVVDQAALDNVRREFAGNKQTELDCLVYTKRYAESYTPFPKEVLLHILAFLVAIVIGGALAAVKI
jgi:hypothetical protein